MVCDGYMGSHFIILFCICLEFSIMKCFVLFLKKRKQRRGWMEEEIEIASVCNLFYRKCFYFNTSVLKASLNRIMGI